MAHILETALTKLGISHLNAMQEESRLAITHGKDICILSPTGSGKTLAFLLPIMELIQVEDHYTQALIVAPSRELAMQIETVAKSMASGLKVNVVYGGRAIKKDLVDLAHPPHILIGTPGRLEDHVRRGNVDGKTITALVLDEYDKSLELGFDETMEALYTALPKLNKRILTSATKSRQLPNWLSNFNPLTIDYLETEAGALTIKRIVSQEKDKLHRLVESLHHLHDKRGIVFLNYKDSIDRTSSFLEEHGIAHTVFYGGLDQFDRERALIKFRNGTSSVLLATDLAARGIDVPEIDYIIHYHLPLREEEFTHRNGRTARMHEEGTAYVLHWKDEKLPDFIPQIEEEIIGQNDSQKSSEWNTIFISGGRQDKISKGDVAGFCMKLGQLDKSEIGLITLNQDCTFVAVKSNKADAVVSNLNNQRLKKRKVRVYTI